MTSQRFLIKGNKKTEIASVAVINGKKILMGQRRDSGRWTLPGGHIEAGESRSEGAQRELFEEAQIKLPPHKFKHLGHMDVESFPDGKPIRVHAFKVSYNGATSVVDDPDEEVKRWVWIDMENMPDRVMNNLHVKGKNVVFEKLGIKQKFVIKDKMKKSMRFVIDIMKAAGHKYLRKFMRGGEWVYIYKEAEGRPRQLDEKAVRAMRVLADRNKMGAREMFEGAEEIKEHKLNALLELSKRGNERAIAALKEMGIGHEEELAHRERLAHPLKKNLDEAGKNKVKTSLEKSVKKMVHRLYESYPDETITRKLKEVFPTPEDITNKIKELWDGKTVHSAIEAVHRVANQIDEAHSEYFRGDPATDGRFNSSYSDAKSAGGYGNLTMNGLIEGLQRDNFLPDNYNEAFKRTPMQGDINIPNPEEVEREIAERAERAARERAEAERIATEKLERENSELVGKHGRSMSDMLAYFNKTLDTAGRVKLMKGIDKFFGKDFSFDEFRQELQGHEQVEIKIGNGFFDGLLDFGGSGRDTASMGVRFSFMKGTRRITSASREIKKNADGSIGWYNSSLSRPSSNDDLKDYPGMARGLYGGVYRFLKKVTANYPATAKKNTTIKIGTAANDGFGNGYKGALVWAKHFFDFPRESVADRWISTWESKIDSYARKANIDLSELKRKVSGYKYPYEFVYTGVVVTKEQALKMTGERSFDFDFNQIFEKKGFVDIGTLIMIDNGDSWSSPTTFVNPPSSNARQSHLKPLREALYGGNRAAMQEMLPTPAEVAAGNRPATSRTTTSASTTPSTSTAPRRRSEAAIRRWAPTGRNRNISITGNRANVISRWNNEAIQHFADNAPLTSAAKRRVLALLD